MRPVLCFFALFSLLFAEEETKEEPTYCDRGIVITVHGFLQNDKSMDIVQRALNFVNLTTYNFNYKSSSGTIRDCGHCLALFAQKVAELNPDRPIHFVTHSLGALLLRVASNDPCFPEKAKEGRVVLFAPPSRGSEVGRKYLNMGGIYKCLGFDIGYELSTYDACDIMHLGSYPESMEILIIAGCKGSRLLMNRANDGVIAVDETGIENPFYFEAFNVTHYDILHYPPALNLCRYFILNEFSDGECGKHPPSKSS